MNQPINKNLKPPLTVTIIATGGTIAKTYANNGLANQSLMIDQMIGALRLPYVSINYVDLLRIDSLEMTAAHRQLIVEEVKKAQAKGHAVIITHGTDTMVETGLVLYKTFIENQPHPEHQMPPIVLTGAMLPFVMMGSDALQNLTESLLACRLLSAGVYIVAHNNVHALPHVRKNYDKVTFEGTVG